jgi:hypothetical protein
MINGNNKQSQQTLTEGRTMKKVKYSCTVGEAIADVKQRREQLEALITYLDIGRKEEPLNNDDIFDFLAGLSQVFGKLRDRTRIIE